MSIKVSINLVLIRELTKIHNQKGSPTKEQCERLNSVLGEFLKKGIENIDKFCDFSLTKSHLKWFVL